MTLKLVLAALVLAPVLAVPVGTGVFVRTAFLGGSPTLEITLFGVVLAVVLLLAVFLVRSAR